MSNTYEPGDKVRILRVVPEGIKVEFYEVAEKHHPDSEQMILNNRQSFRFQIIDRNALEVDAEGIAVLDDDSMIERDEDNLFEELRQDTIIRPEGAFLGYGDWTPKPVVEERSGDPYHFPDNLRAERGEGHGNAF